MQSTMLPQKIGIIISHHWYMPLNKYACHNPHVFPTACLLNSTYRPNITAHISKIIRKCNFNLPCYCHIYVPATNVLLKCNIYAACPNYLMCISEGSRLKYMQHMISPASTKRLSVLYKEDNDDYAMHTHTLINRQ